MEQFVVDSAHDVFGESSSESGEGGMIGSRIIEGESQKRFEGDTVVDLSFQFGIGIDAEPLLEQQALHENNRRIGSVSFGAFPHGVVFHEQVFDTGPVHDSIDLFHSCDSPVLFQRGEECHVGEGEVLFHVFEAHTILP